MAILGLDRTQHQLLCYYFPFVTGSTELASTFVITINNITIFGFSSGVTKRSSPNYRQALNVGCKFTDNALKWRPETILKRGDTEKPNE